MDPYDYTTRPRTVRVSLDATATRPPGRKRAWTVEAGHEGTWRADGPNEKAAGDALAARLQTFLTEYRPPVVLSFRGHVAVIWISLGDDHNPVTWDQQITRPDGYTHHCGVSGESWAYVEAHARHSLAQVTTDWHDDTSVQEGAAFLAGLEGIEHGQYGPEGFYEYAAWQRAARAATEAKRDDWHAWAGEHAREYRVPRPGEQAPDTDMPANVNPWLADA